MKEDDVDPDQMGGSDDSEGLDREHQAHVSEVANCDSAEGRKAAAEVKMGLFTEEIQYLFAERNAQGSDEYVNAIRKSGWFPYTEPLRKGANLLWLLDMLLWTMLWASIVWQLVRAYGNA